MSGKAVLRRLVRALAMRGGALSPTGALLERCGGYLVFITRTVRQEARHASQPQARSAPWAPAKGSGVIYDVGANNGDDTAYYLTKGLPVVAVEADPALARALCDRFPEAIADGRLRVLNLAVADQDGAETVFHVHRQNDKVSTLSPSATDAASYAAIAVPARRLSSIIRDHGSPFYVKIDIEGADAMALQDLLAAGIRPPYVSAEAHSVEGFCRLTAAGYRKFKVVEGFYVDRPHYAAAIGSGEAQPFPQHSSGPFGADLPGEWLSADELFRYLSDFGLGWKDIHATLE